MNHHFAETLIMRFSKTMHVCSCRVFPRAESSRVNLGFFLCIMTQFGMHGMVWFGRILWNSGHKQQGKIPYFFTPAILKVGQEKQVYKVQEIIKVTDSSTVHTERNITSQNFIQVYIKCSYFLIFQYFQGRIMYK